MNVTQAEGALLQDRRELGSNALHAFLLNELLQVDRWKVLHRDERMFLEQPVLVHPNHVRMAQVLGQVELALHERDLVFVEFQQDFECPAFTFAIDDPVPYGAEPPAPDRIQQPMGAEVHLGRQIQRHAISTRNVSEGRWTLLQIRT
jgi:hypothetical protein